jgi:RHS repeat-associated protein
VSCICSWITDHEGIADQRLQYLPFETPFANQYAPSAGYSERFRFTGKERDEETGFGYFGARYMDHELLISFLSVDRYANKYPFISPYAYCAWNPIKLTDPSGDSVYLKGTEEARMWGLKEMQKRTENLHLKIDKSGLVSYEGEPVTAQEEKMVEILNSDKYIVNLKIQKNSFIAIDPNGKKIITSEGGGSFMGNRLNDDNSKAYGMQVLNALDSREVDPQSGTNIWHEIMESFVGCRISLDDRKKSCRYYDKEEMDIVYPQAHAEANEYFCGNVLKFTWNGRTVKFLDPTILLENSNK